MTRLDDATLDLALECGLYTLPRALAEEVVVLRSELAELEQIVDDRDAIILRLTDGLRFLEQIAGES